MIIDVYRDAVMYIFSMFISIGTLLILIFMALFEFYSSINDSGTYYN